MKNEDNQYRQNNRFRLGISVTIDEAPFLKNLVEKLAHRRYETGYSLVQMPSGWRAVDTSSIEAYISGSMDILNNGEQIALSYTTCFSFTCTRPAGKENSLSWLNSLS